MHIARFAFLIALFAAFLAGCSAGRPPVTPVEKSLGLTPELAARYSRDAEWWKIYGDDRLNALVDKALERNADYRKTALAVNRALYLANRSGAGLLPETTGGATASASREVESSASSTRNFRTELQVRYEVDLWNKLEDASAAQRWEYQATREDREAAGLALAAAVAENFFALARLESAINAGAESVNNYRIILEKRKAAHLAGKIDGIEPEQAAQSLLAAQNSLLGLETQKILAEQALRLLLHMEPEESFNFNFSQDFAPDIPVPELDVPVAALANRPDLKAAEFRLQKAFKDISATQKSLYPSISVSAALSSSSQNSAATMFDLPFTAGMVSINLPFLQWNVIKWDIKISQNEYDRLKLDFEQGVNTALNELDAAVRQYEKNRAVLANMEKKLEYDLAVSKRRKAMYENGKNDLADWLASINSVEETRQGIFRERENTLKSLNAIYRSMAGRYQARL